MTDAPLPNPERAWHPDHRPAIPPRAELEARVGPLTRDPVLLSGGLANLNLDLGDGRVLRLYLRDAASIPREVALMRTPWRHLRVPAVLDHGHDHVLMERVPHTPTLGTAEHGRALGRALAEVHARRFDTAGFLTEDARSIATPFASVTDAFSEYVQGLEPLEPALRDTLTARLDADRAWLDADPVLLHGDFKASNLHACADGDLPLVLDWEFAYAGPALMDIGQLFRWGAPDAFADAFASAYTAGGRALPGDWRSRAARADAVNLAGLLARSEPGSARAQVVRERLVACVGGAWAV
jgi:aminoglycoside phosphotransferase (APT) family kinase protein